jgi:hypothetical protein
MGLEREGTKPEKPANLIRPAGVAVPPPPAPTPAPGAVSVVPAGSRFICAYCMKPLAIGAACECDGWKAATAKLQAMAAGNVAPEPAKEAGPCGYCGKPPSSHSGAELSCPGFETLGHVYLAPAISLPPVEVSAIEEWTTWVTCDGLRAPHLYSSSCCGVVRSVPAPEEPRGIMTALREVADLRGSVPPVIERWLALGKAGVTVSICYGPAKRGVLGFSVDAMSGTGQTFEQPFAAESFEHAVAIAERESLARGWLAN